jgi:ubiquinone/menaquinone biosynthesis C-methylase UbiE
MKLRGFRWSRHLLKIEAVLALHVEELSGRSILDIGAGSGHISAHFASKNTVTAADVENQLCIGQAELEFVRLQSATLPFGDASFDIVILNQVLTYIPDQLNELQEIRRILKPSGVCYISLPNKTFPIEPHAKVPFVHYLPHALYKKLMGWLTGANEEIHMHSYYGMIELFNESGFDARDYTVEVLHNPERYFIDAHLRFPAWSWISIISPTNIFVLKAKR